MNCMGSGGIVDNGVGEETGDGVSWVINDNTVVGVAGSVIVGEASDVAELVGRNGTVGVLDIEGWQAAVMSASAATRISPRICLGRWMKLLVSSPDARI